MKNDTRMWLFYNSQPVRNNNISAESKITKLQPENSFYCQYPNLMLTMWYLLLKLLKAVLCSINLHLETLHQQPHLCAVEHFIGFTRAKWRLCDIMGKPDEINVNENKDKLQEQNEQEQFYRCFISWNVCPFQISLLAFHSSTLSSTFASHRGLWQWNKPDFCTSGNLKSIWRRKTSTGYRSQNLPVSIAKG